MLFGGGYSLSLAPSTRSEGPLWLVACGGAERSGRAQRYESVSLAHGCLRSVSYPIEGLEV